MVLETVHFKPKKHPKPDILWYQHATLNGPISNKPLPDQGLAVWHIMENPAVYGNLPPPPGVSAAQWAEVAPNEWGRRGVRMLRPVPGPGIDDTRALYDGADPQTGYDLLSVDPNPAHTVLRWADGTPSGFEVRA